MQRSRRKRRRTLVRLLGALALVVLAVQLWFFGHVLYWVHANPRSTSFMQARLELLRRNNPRVQLAHVWVPYSAISVNLKRAVIAAEDARFVEHHGFDWQGIEYAMEENERRGKVVAGGSTITQQLAKNLFLSGERTWLRKGQEALITVMLEAAMSKRRILEIYLNVIEWGSNVFGAEAAAARYFGVHASQLTPAEAARLAAMLPRPRFYQRHLGSRHLARDAARILARMPRARLP